MKISVRKYLRDLEEAEQKGHGKAIVENDERERMERRLQYMGDRVEKLAKRVEQLGHLVETCQPVCEKQAERPVPGSPVATNPGDTFF